MASAAVPHSPFQHKERVRDGIRNRNPELTALIQRISQGDQLAFATLYDATRSLVYGLAVRIVRDQSTAEDVTIEVYQQVYQQAGQYTSDRGTPSAWLLTLTRSRAIDRLRQHTLRQQRESPLDAIAFTSPLPDPETSSVANELRRAVRNALATLSKEQRQVIEIAYYAGLSHPEIAAQLGQPLGTVKTRIRTGMMMLRAQLRPLLGDPVEA
jgi:RNA polymerase sigma-70 factor (ECF subfamily)